MRRDKSSKKNKEVCVLAPLGSPRAGKVTHPTDIFFFFFFHVWCMSRQGLMRLGRAASATLPSLIKKGTDEGGKEVEA